MRQSHSYWSSTSLKPLVIMAITGITAIKEIIAVMTMTNILSTLQSTVTSQANSANFKLLGFLRSKYNGHYITGLNKPV